MTIVAEKLKNYLIDRPRPLIGAETVQLILLWESSTIPC